ncbi:MULTISPECIES: phosphoribosyltransferase-like protein [Rhizobium]|uniref:PRTase-CE domain-containing protein n=1 Tax=Rhizobium phaseoli TaxID=396 RepID=A0A7X6FAN4_9HYPH|nr:MULTISPECIES: hypothetical protein [Rhizobium]MDE8763858.1 hypothetical protein [Rhizobium sp. CBK13]NKF15087.1 hypothetical protein [Rhizobium phaseoli]QPK09174.1 hypothetical protein HER27_000905 [Rhizobium phaseoli]
MKYPKAIADNIYEIEEIFSRWPSDVDVTLQQVINWILQFDEPDFHIAIRVLRNVNVVGQRDIRQGLKVAYSKLSRKAIEKGAPVKSTNTLFTSLAGVGKSGAMISYHLRMATDISEENFLSDDTLPFVKRGDIANLVFVDDVISTGRQASKAINETAEKMLLLGVQNMFVLTVCGMREGLDRIQEETKAYTFSAFEYGLLDVNRRPKFTPYRRPILTPHML